MLPEQPLFVKKIYEIHSDQPTGDNDREAGGHLPKCFIEVTSPHTDITY